MASLLLPLLPRDEAEHRSQTMHIQLSLQGEQGLFIHGTALQPVLDLSHSRACMSTDVHMIGIFPDKGKQFILNYGKTFKV